MRCSQLGRVHFDSFSAKRGNRARAACNKGSARGLGWGDRRAGFRELSRRLLDAGAAQAITQNIVMDGPTHDLRCQTYPR